MFVVSRLTVKDTVQITCFKTCMELQFRIAGLRVFQMFAIDFIKIFVRFFYNINISLGVRSRVSG